MAQSDRNARHHDRRPQVCYRHKSNQSNALRIVQVDPHEPASRCSSLVTTPSDDRSPAAKAYQWSSRIMVVSLEMVLPGIAGYWLDKRLGTVVLFMLIGFCFGSTAAIVHLIRMTRADANRIRND